MLALAPGGSISGHTVCSEASCKKPNPPLMKQQVLPICANPRQSARIDPGHCLVLSESLQCKGPFLRGPSFNLAGNCGALHTGLDSAPHRWLQAPYNTCARVLDQEVFVSIFPIAALLSCTSVPSFPSTLPPPHPTLPLLLCPSSNFQNSVSAVRSANESQARLRVLCLFKRHVQVSWGHGNILNIKNSF